MVAQRTPPRSSLRTVEGGQYRESLGSFGRPREPPAESERIWDPARVGVRPQSAPPPPAVAPVGGIKKGGVKCEIDWGSSSQVWEDQAGHGVGGRISEQELEEAERVQAPSPPPPAAQVLSLARRQLVAIHRDLTV